MACAKRRKVDTENKAFNPEWTEAFMFILPVGSLKPLCLICSDTVAVVKSGNVKHHYETKLKITFDKSYPANLAVILFIIKLLFIILS